MHVNRLLMRKLAEACENTAESLQDFTCLHTGNGPNRATRIPANFKPSRDVRLLAELKVTGCDISVLSGWEREEFLRTHGWVVCCVLGPATAGTT